MIQVETQEVDTGKWFPIVQYTPGNEIQRRRAKSLALALVSQGLLARVTSPDLASK